jgi:hypothetical protein
MEQIVKDALDLYKLDSQAWNDIYEAAREDLRFMSDEQGCQWQQDAYNQSIQNGRIALQIDQLQQFINQTVNDIRINTPTIKIIPDGDDANTETAEVFQGLIRNIEYQSNADSAYDMAAEFAVKSSIGFIRIDHEYEDEESFNQRLCFKRVINPLAIILDSESVEADGSDAMHAFVLEKISVAKFKKDYPKFNPVSFNTDQQGRNKPLKDDDTITICEFFKIHEESVVMGQLEDGSKEEAQEGIAYVATRRVTKRKVKRYILSGQDVLEQGDFPGRYIPIIPVYGQEAWQEGERKLFSLIRKSKGAQQQFNLWKSLETELLLRAPKATYTAAAGQTEDFAEDYLYPDKAAVLRYKHKDESGQPYPALVITPPPQPPVGIIGAARGAVDDIKATMGLYNASIGARSNETSGVAINARKLEGDIATYHFSDNLTKAIAHAGKVLVFATPDVYDTPRTVRVITPEDESVLVGINGAMVEDQQKPVDLRTGKYTVKVITGPSFTTRRQEALAYLTEAFKGNPALMQVAGDLYFKYSDFPGADAIAERLKRTIPKEILGEDEDAQDPEKAQMVQALQQSQATIAAMEAELKNMQDSLELKQADLALKAQSEANDQEIERARLVLEQEKIAIERYKLDIEAARLINEDNKLRQQQEIAVANEIAARAIIPFEGIATSNESMIQ